MSFFKLISMGIFTLLITGCASDSRYLTAYQPIGANVGPSDAYLLDAGVSPRLVFTENFEDDLKIFTDQDYGVVGQSYFTGPLEGIDDAAQLGTDLKVTHVLLSAEFAYSGSKKAYKFKSGHYYMPSGVNYDYGYRRTTYDRMPDIQSIPYRKEVQIYKQQAVYLVKLKD